MAPIAYNQFSNPPLYLNGKATVNIPVAIPGNTAAGNYFIFVELSGSCDKVAANNLSNPIPLQITTGTPGTYCTSTSNFPWEDWIVSAIEHAGQQLRQKPVQQLHRPEHHAAKRP
ncbi:MAG: hypothetical protein H6577_25505 [Lewinellaceae bacterium]|nr:hypothetical protein [Lewinellaceae bacterium]